MKTYFLIKILASIFIGANYILASSIIQNSKKKDFSKLIDGLSKKELARIKAGFSLYSKPWVSAPASTKVRDGLGPHFNAVSCTSCHAFNGRGSVDNILFRLGKNEIYGSQFQPRSILGVSSEGVISTSYKKNIFKFKDGQVIEMHEPKYKVIDLNYGVENLNLSPRIAPIIAGVGLIDQISQEDIIANEVNGGKANLLVDAYGNLRVGRFGWRAERATLYEQNAAAFNADLGITSTLFPNENCTSFQADCLNAPSGGDIEIADRHLEMVTEFSASIDRPQVKRLAFYSEGKKIFKRLDCIKCHTQEYQIKNRKIRPYSDFLTHDMGEGLADDFSSRWKTPPLWGIGSLKKINGHLNLLHDGRAKSIEEAILWHDGEARSSREQFEVLDAKERLQLTNFLKSI